jgi:hypothetical protein
MQTIEQEILQLATDWKKTAREMIAKSDRGSRSEMVNLVLFACAEVLQWKITTNKIPQSG